MAHRGVVQSGRLPDQWIPLGLFRVIGCECRPQPWRDSGLPGGMPGRGGMDLQNGIPVEELAAGLEPKSADRREMPMLKSLKLVGQHSVCKVCGQPASLYGVVD